ncbi:MAG: MotA/TolQ/ExbB proton channel family protein [Candidatus Sumerlaeota bacterium]
MKSIMKRTPLHFQFAMILFVLLLVVAFRHNLIEEYAWAQDAPDDIVEYEEVSVDWFAELAKGGMTVVFLGLLSVTGVVFALERYFRLKPKYVAPSGLVDQVLELEEDGDFEGIRELCRKHKSDLARILEFVVEHRGADAGALVEGAGDISARQMRNHLQRNQPLAVVAALAPLLGLLGTMIGMIEAFQLVAVYGDEGGAPMLAGSISKALITTAVGLILAIPALAAYHFFKVRTNLLFSKLEEEAERLFNHWFLRPGAAWASPLPAHRPAAATVAGASPSGDAVGPAPSLSPDEPEA